LGDFIGTVSWFSPKILTRIEFGLTHTPSYLISLLFVKVDFGLIWNLGRPTGPAECQRPVVVWCWCS